MKAVEIAHLAEALSNLRAGMPADAVDAYGGAVKKVLDRINVLLDVDQTVKLESGEIGDVEKPQEAPKAAPSTQPSRAIDPDDIDALFATAPAPAVASSDPLPPTSPTLAGVPSYAEFQEMIRRHGHENPRAALERWFRETPFDACTEGELLSLYNKIDAYYTDKPPTKREYVGGRTSRKADSGGDVPKNCPLCGQEGKYMPEGKYGPYYFCPNRDHAKATWGNKTKWAKIKAGV